MGIASFLRKVFIGTKSNNKSSCSINRTSNSNFDGLTKNQKKVKTLGQALVSKVCSKKKAKDILVKKYNFKESTAKYAAGYKGYKDW